MNTANFIQDSLRKLEEGPDQEKPYAPRRGQRPLEVLLSTDGSWTLVVLRLTLAAVILPHGAQKAFGWFGGYGFDGTMSFFTDTLGIPYALGLLAILAELVGPIALAAGFFTRIAAFGIGAVMLVATLMVHLPNGFFMDWFGTMDGEGYEFFILAIGITVSLFIGGGGRLSFDGAYVRRHT